MRDHLDPDETIISVLPDLADPDGYVRRVFGLLHRHADRDRLSVRIGVQGTGQKPYFRVVRDSVDGQPDADDQIVGAYYDNGDTLRTSASTNANWSTATTPYKGVVGILESWRSEREAKRGK